jgi:hypothetical protein
VALPDFLIVGAPKAGSTAIHDALVAHPQLFLSRPKEPKFFMTDGTRPPRHEHRGPGDAHSSREWVWHRDRYESLFDAAPPGFLKGESTPFYLWDRAAHRRIAETIPDVRMIAVIRDPVDRAHSNWAHLYADGLEPEADFMRACRREPDRIAAGYAPFWRYLELGRYGEQFAHLFTLFFREQVHVVRYRELIDDPARTLDGICAFLGIDTGLLTEIPPSNASGWSANTPFNSALRLAVRTGAVAGSYADPRLWRAAERRLVRYLKRGNSPRPRVTVEERRELVEYFREDVALLEQMLGRSFEDWLSDQVRGTYAERKSWAPSSRVASQ